MAGALERFRALLAILKGQRVFSVSASNPTASQPNLSGFRRVLRGPLF
jgi:hypothetical protein